jgi:hypothetical protein
MADSRSLVGGTSRRNDLSFLSISPVVVSYGGEPAWSMELQHRISKEVGDTEL